MTGREIQLRLFRDALSTPWGFRLAGGKDLHAPLIVQRVAVGSPVDGELRRGDIILEIQNQNASLMTHKQAQDAIRNAGGSLVLRVKRPSGSQHTDSPIHTPASAYNYQPSQRGFMLGRLQETLSNVVGYPASSSGYGSDYNNYPFNTPISTPQSSFDSGANVHYPSWTRSAPRQRPPTITPLADPGWTPQCLLNQQRQGRRPQTAAEPARVISSYVSGRGHTPSYSTAQEPEPPAWLGSLRPSVESKTSDQRAAGFHPSGGAGNGYQGQSSNQSGGPTVIALPEGAQHLQYNSPLGLYNKASVQQAITGYFGGSDGLNAANGTAGTNDSDVYRLVQETDRKTHRTETAAAAKASSRLDLPQSANPDTIRQSPSIRLLESHLNQGQDQNNTVGITDF